VHLCASTTEGKIALMAPSFFASLNRLRAFTMPLEQEQNPLYRVGVMQVTTSVSNPLALSTMWTDETWCI
jgi:hypothetical protein